MFDNYKLEDTSLIPGVIDKTREGVERKEKRNKKEERRRGVGCIPLQKLG